MTNTYTLADLQAMTDDGLNALAAELRGLQYLPRSGNVFDFVWMDGDKVYTQEIAFTANRNQSGELLEYATAQGAGFIIDRFGGSSRIACYQGKDCAWICAIPGNDARAETIAFIAVMLAMKGQLQ